MEMNQHNQSNAIFPTPAITIKKKRGRPKKDPTEKPTKPAHLPHKLNPAQKHTRNPPIPPGFEESNVRQPQPFNTSNDNNMNSMVGQRVTGVIEAIFDAGFLLSVRVGGSDTSLRGVVFKTGHYVPISDENDIAPGVQMVTRNEVPFPVGVQSQKNTRRGRKQTEHRELFQSNGSQGSNQMAQAIVPAQTPGVQMSKRNDVPFPVGIQSQKYTRRGKKHTENRDLGQCNGSLGSNQLALVPAHPPAPDPLESRGTRVPVLLQPVKLSNRAMPAVEVRPVVSQPAHLAASKGRHRCSTRVVQAENDSVGLASQSMKGVNESRKSMRNMLSDEFYLGKEAGEGFSGPMYIEPLQTIYSRAHDRYEPLLHSFPERSSGRMTELLMAVEENLMEPKMSDPRHELIRNPNR